MVVMTIFVVTSCYDDDDLWNSVNALDGRVTNLESQVNAANANITTITSVISNIRQNTMISSYTQTADGYMLTFSDGKSISLKNGTNGKDAPAIGVKADENGVYYWTITADGKTNLLTDAKGNKLAVTGVTPLMGVDSEGYWTVDLGKGATRILNADAKAVKAIGEPGDSFFKSVVENGDIVVLTLSDGSVINLPKASAYGVTVVDFDGGFKGGETKSFVYTLKNADDCMVYSVPDGWTANVKNGKLTVTAPVSAASGGYLKLIVSDVNGNLKMSKLVVYIYKGVKTVDFEGDYWNALIPNLDYNDPLIYGTGYGSSVNYKWSDAVTSLSHEFPSVWGVKNYMGAGMAISDKVLTDLTQGNFNHELAVPVAGGHDGSKNFAVHHGNSDGMNGVSETGLPSIYFSDGTEKVIDNMYVCPTTYLLNSMSVDGTYSKALTAEDTLYLTAAGYDASGSKTGEVTFYMAKDGKFVKNWTKWNLAPLGKVSRVYFNVNGSANTYNAYGFSQPAYFAFDDVAVRY